MAGEDDILYHPTPLHGAVADLARANLWVPWRGYSAVAVYGDVVEEVTALRRTIGISDFSPYPAWEITGAECAAYLDRLLTRPVAAMAEGEVKDALLCASSGHVITLATVFRLAENRFLLMCAGEVGARLQDAKGKAQVDISPSRYVSICLTGPGRGLVLSELGVNREARAEAFVSPVEHKGTALLIGNAPSAMAPACGGTLIFVEQGEAALEWDRLIKVGSKNGLLPVGRDALERRRIDLGVPREGTEFDPAPLARDDDARALPAEIGLGHLVELDGRPFAGAGALQTAIPARQLVRVEVDEVLPLRGQALRAGAKTVGRVTSAYEAPELGVTRAIGLINADAPLDLSVGPIGAALPAHCTPVELR